MECVHQVLTELREFPRRGGRKSVRARGDGGHQRNKAIESTKQHAYKLTETETARPGPLCICNEFQFSIFMGLLRVCMSEFLILEPSLGLFCWFAL